ncbi:MAG: hypothetical protein IPN05_04985 [Sulfuritalea sp.]|nr:hypothetical protein [Sulfuritalea sp.]
MPEEKLVEAVEHFGPVLLHGLLQAEGFGATAVFGDQPLGSRDALGLDQQRLALLLGHAWLEAEILFQFLEAQLVAGLRLVVDGCERAIEQFGQTTTAQGAGFLVDDDFAEEGAHLAVVPANDAVEAEIERLGLVELEQLRHQFDEARLQMGELGMPLGGNTFFST